jgi:hypothetical protein
VIKKLFVFHSNAQNLYISSFTLSFKGISGGFILIACSSQKVKEGKIVKVEAEFDNVITKLKISGDFFLHPEDVLDDIEESMLDLKRDVSFDTLVLKIHDIIKNYDAQMIGISPESLASVIKEALK